MKRVIIIIIITIISVSVNGQNHFLGIKGGVNWANISESDFIDNTDYRTGLAVGVTYDYNFKKYFSTGIDIIYDQRGFRDKVIFTDQIGIPLNKEMVLEYNYDYIAIPVKIGFNYGEKIYGFANAGITPAIVVNGKHIIPSFEIEGTEIPKVTENVANKVNRFDIGGFIEIGAGYKFKDRYCVFTSVSYQHSFTNITNPNYMDGLTIKHYMINLNLGLKYALMKG